MKPVPVYLILEPPMRVFDSRIGYALLQLGFVSGASVLLIGLVFSCLGAWLFARLEGDGTTLSPVLDCWHGAPDVPWPA